MDKFQLIAAPFTPFTVTNEVNLARIPRYMHFLRHNGAQGAFVCGTTGEASSLTVAERQSLNLAWSQAAPPEFPIIANVSHECLNSAQELASRAEYDHVAGIAVAAPCTFKIPTIDELVNWCVSIAQAAPTMPFYYYYIPQLSGVVLPMRYLIQKLYKTIPTFAGIKFSDTNLADFAACCAFGEKRGLKMYFGKDEMLHSALVCGADGAVGSTYNFMPRLYRDLLAMHYEAEDEVEAGLCQLKATQVIHEIQCQDPGFIGFAKAIMKLCGLDCGPVRLPLRQPSAKDESALFEKLSQLGFEKFCSKVPT